MGGLLGHCCVEVSCGRFCIGVWGYILLPCRVVSCRVVSWSCPAGPMLGLEPSPAARGGIRGGGFGGSRSRRCC